jgi:ADP-ribose pyrophosphatase
MQALSAVHKQTCKVRFIAKGKHMENKQWQTISSKEITKAEQRFSVFHDVVKPPTGNNTNYYHVDYHDGVMVVPIKVSTTDIKFVMVEQYRYPTKTTSLEFPGGSKDKLETSEQSARRELLEETGYKAEEMRFIYVMNSSVWLSGNKTFVYLAILSGEQESRNLEESEQQCELKVVELTSKEVWEKVRHNEINDTRTLAALNVVLMQSPKAMQFLEMPEKGDK